MTYLALRKTIPTGLPKTLFAKLTMYRLVTRYPHSGIVVEDTLYHATFADGVHSSPFNSNGWDVFKIDIPQELILERFQSVKGAKYDWFSLLAFVLPFRFSVAKWFYCYELVYFMITGNIPIQRITPEDLLRIANATTKSY
jgi:hypothetical protein